MDSHVKALDRLSLLHEACRERYPLKVIQRMWNTLFAKFTLTMKEAAAQIREAVNEGSVNTVDKRTERVVMCIPRSERFPNTFEITHPEGFFQRVVLRELNHQRKQALDKLISTQVGGSQPLIGYDEVLGLKPRELNQITHDNVLEYEVGSGETGINPSQHKKQKGGAKKEDKLGEAGKGSTENQTENK